MYTINKVYVHTSFIPFDHRNIVRGVDYTPLSLIIDTLLGKQIPRVYNGIIRLLHLFIYSIVFNNIYKNIRWIKSDTI